MRAAPDGDVSSADAVVDTLGDAEALTCVKHVVQSLVLPGPAAVIVVPLMFAP